MVAVVCIHIAASRVAADVSLPLDELVRLSGARKAAYLGIKKNLESGLGLGRDVPPVEEVAVQDNIGADTISHVEIQYVLRYHFLTLRHLGQ